jgi:hypothetical protein
MHQVLIGTRSWPWLNNPHLEEVQKAPHDPEASLTADIAG